MRLSRDRIFWKRDFMTKRPKQNENVVAYGKKEWHKPEVRAVVPASHTRGGAVVATSEDPTFYRIS
jgi:hypothetical protein